MPDDRTTTKQKPGTCTDVPPSESATREDRPIGFDCCGVAMADEMAGCPCGSLMRRHPVVTFTVLTLMGLAVVAISAGAILGIIAFARTL